MYRKIKSYFLYSFITLFCAVALLFSTPWGSHLTVVLINKTTPLSVGYQDGIFLENIKLSHFSLNEKNLSVNAKNIALKLNPKCIWQQKLCIDELAIQSLFVHSKQLSKQAQRSATPNSQRGEVFTFPLTIKADYLQVKKFVVLVDDVSITGENFETRALLDDSTVALLEPKIGLLSITLSDKNPSKPASKTEADVNKLWPVTSLPVISLPINLLIEKAQVKTLTLLPINDSPQQLNNSQLTLSWQETELAIKHIETEHTIYGSATLEGEANFIPPYTLNLTALSEVINIQGSPLITSLFDGTLQRTSIKGDLSALTLESQLTGNVELTVKGQVDLTKKELPFTCNITINKYPELDRLFAVNKPIKASITANGDITKQQFIINALFSAYGYQDAALSLHASNQDSHLTINEVDFNDSHTQSELSLNGMINYSENLVWDFTLTSSGVTLPTIHNEQVDLSGRISGNIDFSGEKKVQQWSVKLNNSAVEGVINNIPISATGNVELDIIGVDRQWQLKPSHLTLTAGDAKLDLNGFTDENWHVTGLLSIPTLEKFISDSRGELSSTFKIEGVITAPNIQFDNRIRHLYWQNIASAEMQFIGHYQPLQSHKIDFSLISDKVVWQDLALTSFAVKLKGDIEQQSINVKWLGDLTANLFLTSTWLSEAKQWRSQLINSDISFQGKQWQPDKNIAIHYQQMTNTLWIEQHCWQGKSIHLCSANDITIANTGEIALLVDLELKDIGDFFIPDDIKVTTKLQNKISLKWSPHEPLSWLVNSTLSEGNIKLLKTHDLSDQPLTIAWKKGDAAFHFNNNILTSHLFITPKTGQQTQDNVALIDINSKIDFANGKRLSGKIMIKDLSLFFLQAYLSEVNQLNGSLNTDINISGSLDSPDFYGSMAINNTEISLVRSANSIDDLTINLELLGKEAKLVGQGLINKGVANITGKLSWHDQFNTLINFNADQLSLLHPPHISAVISPNINIELNKQSLNLTGDIDIKEGDITINKLPEGSVTMSNDVIIVNDNGEEINQTTRFTITTDLKLNIADNINISGYGFNGVLGGKILVKQQPHQDVQLFGNLNILDGLYRAYGQRLAVNKGRVSFNGPADNPLIDLRAIRYLSKENVTAGIEIYGPANALSINLFSTPTKSKSEILSYIVRGRGIDTEAKSNSSLGITLGATLVNSSGLLEQIEKLPFINNLEIEGDDQQASIAGYVGNNLYLKYGVGVAEPVNELTVRFYLLNRLWIEVVSGLERSADLYFSFEVD